MSSIDPVNSIAERNLIFAGLALGKGWIDSHHINHAFTLWICNKTQTLGDILVEMKVLTPDQNQAINREISQKLIQEKDTVLAGMECLEDLKGELDFLDDLNINETLAGAQKVKSAENHPPPPQPPVDPDSKQPSGSSSKQENGSQSGPVPPETSPSDRFEPYDYLKSQGGMGELWRSKDKELNRDVVVKYIKRFRAHDPNFRGLFHLEGEVTGHLEHPNIPPVYSLGKDTLSRDFFAMRYFIGSKLTEAIRDYHCIPYHNHSERKEKLVDLLQSFQTACLTVEFAHTRGIIHCDIKPDNILVGGYGETLVIDWGLVVVKNAPQPIDQDAMTQTRYAENINYFNPSKSASSGLHVKQGGSRKSVGGTLAYMPPEQLKATESGDINLISYSSDVFGLGATLYHLLVGRPPYLPKTKEKETKTHFYDRIRKGDFLPPRSVNSQIPRPLESIVKKAMACDPSQRYANPRELADDIRRWLSDEPAKAHPEYFPKKMERWLKKHKLAVLSASSVLVLSGIVSYYLLLNEGMKTKVAYGHSVELAKNGFEQIETFDPFYSKSQHYLDQKKGFLYVSKKKMEDLLEIDENNPVVLYEYIKLLRVLGNSWKVELKLDQAIELFEKGLKHLNDKKRILKENKGFSLFDIQYRRDYSQLKYLKGKVKQSFDSLIGLYDQVDGNNLPGVNEKLILAEKIVLAKYISDCQNELPQSNQDTNYAEKFIRENDKYINEINWKNPWPQDLLLLGVYLNCLRSLGTAEKQDFATKTAGKVYGVLSDCFSIIESGEYIGDFMPDVDFQFFISSYLLELVSMQRMVDGKKESMEQLKKKAIKALEDLSRKFPAVPGFLKKRVEIKLTESDTEFAAGNYLASRGLVDNALDDCKKLLLSSPTQYHGNMLYSNALLKKMKTEIKLGNTKYIKEKIKELGARCDAMNNMFGNLDSVKRFQEEIGLLDFH